MSYSVTFGSVDAQRSTRAASAGFGWAAARVRCVRRARVLWEGKKIIAGPFVHLRTRQVPFGLTV
jgi:hypothetical protein